MSGQTVVVSVLADTKNFSDGFKTAAGVATAAVAAVGVAAAAFIATSIKAAAEAEKVAAQTTAVLASTGEAAGRTADQVSDLASKISAVTGIDDEALQSAENLLLTFTQIKGTNFDAATQAVADMSVAMGTDLSSAATLVGKALNDPVKGIGALSKVGVQLTDDQKALIKSMVEVGDVAGAQAVILGELNTQFGGSAEAFGNTFLGSIERVKNAFGNVQEIIGGAFLPVLTAVFGKVADVLGALASNPAFNTIVTNIGTFITGLLSGEGAVGGFASQLAPLLGFLSPFGIILQVIKPLLPQLADGLGQVAKVIGGTLGSVLPIITGLLQKVVGVLSGALAAILPKLIPLIVTIAEVFGTVLAAVLPVVVTLLDAVVQVVVALIPVLLPIIDAVLNVVQAFLPLVGVRAGLIGPLLTPLIDLLTQLLVPILGLIAPILDLLVPAMKIQADVMAFLIGIIIGVIKFLVDLATGNEEAQAKVREVWENILSFFKGVPAAIGGFFSDAGKLLVNAGRNIIDGLLNGIKGAVSGLMDFVGGIGKNIASTFASVLGIHSPSRVFAGFGKNVLQGLENGLSSANGLDAIMARITSQVNGGFTAELAAPSGYAGGYAGKTYNVTVQAVAPNAEVGRAVVQAIDEYERIGGTR